MTLKLAILMQYICQWGEQEMETETALKRLKIDDIKCIKCKLKHLEFSFHQQNVTQTQYTWPWP